MSSYFKARDELVKMYIKSLEEGRSRKREVKAVLRSQSGTDGRRNRQYCNGGHQPAVWRQGHRQN